MTTETKTTAKVRLTNDFHNSSVNVVGELTDMGKGRGNRDWDGQPPEGFAQVRISDRQAKRAGKTLCGMADCCCGNHGPRMEPEDGSDSPTWLVTGEIVS